MFKLIGINLIIDALWLIAIIYQEVRDDGNATVLALFILWFILILLTGLLTTGIFLLML